MNVIFDYAIMLDDSAGIDDHIFFDHDAAIHDGACHQGNAASQVSRGRNRRSGMNGADRLKSASANHSEQITLVTGIGHTSTPQKKFTPAPKFVPEGRLLREPARRSNGFHRSPAAGPTTR